ncbi:MAG: hypothetical protein AAGF04_05390 [Chlamydiota bacterium]
MSINKIGIPDSRRETTFCSYLHNLTGRFYALVSAVVAFAERSFAALFSGHDIENSVEENFHNLHLVWENEELDNRNIDPRRAF